MKTENSTESNQDLINKSTPQSLEVVYETAKEKQLELIKQEDKER